MSDFMKCSLFHSGFAVIYAWGLFSFTDVCLCLTLLFVFFSCSTKPIPTLGMYFLAQCLIIKCSVVKKEENKYNWAA